MDAELPLRPSGSLDITASPDASTPHGRPFLQVMFRCANAYLRVYRSSDGQRYLARCPKCGKEVRFQVGEGGTSQRQFDVSCT
jgi:phage terminase large subunit GpA-like protein